MSKYRRDDQKFREQIATLADAGLRLDRSIKTAREAMVEPLEIAPKGKLPEFVAGAIAATIVLLLVAGAAYLGWRIL